MGGTCVASAARVLSMCTKLLACFARMLEDYLHHYYHYYCCCYNHYCYYCCSTLEVL